MQKRLSLMLIILCSLLGTLVQVTSSQTDAFNRGLQAYNRKDYATALREWRPLAERGDASAQTWLGWMYVRGEGVPEDRAEAVRWYQKAAAQGHALAKSNLQAIYSQAHTPLPSASTLSVSAPSQAVSNIPSVSATLLAQPRRALVIGNAAYPDNPLANPVNDATDLAVVLRRLGFETTLRQNADKPTMEQAIEEFTRGAPRGSVGLFFFSGHGVQIEGVNYLVPLGAHFSAPSDVKYRAVAADWSLERMDDSGMDVKLLILDACRNNPLGRSWTRAATRGLAVMETPKGSLIAYATSPGKTASDGTGRNSPFTARLLREVTVPGRPIELVLKAVRVGVQQETNGQQIPWEASSLIGEFVFAR